MAVLWNRINTFLLVLVLLALASIAGLLATRVEGGPLDPPTAPQSTLPQVEPRMPIPPVGWNGTYPIVLSAETSYFFTQSLFPPVGVTQGIRVEGSRVTIDLNGFSFNGRTTGVGIQGQFSETVTIKNGSISSWGTGIGFAFDASSPNLLVSNVRMSDNVVAIEAASEAEIKDCTMFRNGTGISGRFLNVHDCTFTRNQLAINITELSVVNDNFFYRNGTVGGGPGALVGSFVTLRRNWFEPIGPASFAIRFEDGGNIFLENRVPCANGIDDGGFFASYAPFNASVEHSNTCL